MIKQDCEISVIIPCYNSAEIITELMERLTITLSKLHLSYEIIFINDCSKDETLSKLAKIAKINDTVKVIDLMFNVGQFRALICGLKHAKGKYIVTMDDDLQHPPEEIPKLFRHLSENPELDIVIGKYRSKKHGHIRNFFSAILKKINQITFNQPKTLHSSAFRCMRRSLSKTITSYKTIFPVIGPLIFQSTNRIANIDVEHHPRKNGKSNYSILKLIKTTLDNIINFSSAPLKYISLLGIIISVISLIFATYFVVRNITNPVKLPGWTSIIVLINIYGGLVLLTLGILGEYLVRILHESKQQPIYKIRTIYKKE